MVQLGDMTVKINFEMTEISKAMLRNEVLKLLNEPEVLEELLKLLTQVSRLEVGRCDGQSET